MHSIQNRQIIEVVFMSQGKLLPDTEQNKRSSKHDKMYHVKQCECVVCVYLCVSHMP